MPRLSGTVFAGIPRHITQRGNRRENIFFSDDDRNAYLGWLQAYCNKHEVDILAYCLMTNHPIRPNGDSYESRVKNLFMIFFSWYWYIVDLFHDHAKSHLSQRYNTRTV